MENKIKLIKALADNTRFKLIELLLCHNYCVRALSKKLNISEAGISQHLKVLRKAGLVWGEKRGYFTHYMVNKKALKNLAEELIALCEESEKLSDCQRKQSCNKSCDPS